MSIGVLRRKKTKSWKQYCTLTPANNPWNEVYKIATGKTRNNQTLTTLRRTNGKTTETMEETIELMLEHLTPMDDPREDTNQQKETRRQTVLPINTADDKEFTQDEVRQIVGSFKYRKAPVPNGITNEIIKMVFKAYQRL
jgi:hypothetical protein